MKVRSSKNSRFDVLFEFSVGEVDVMFQLLRLGEFSGTQVANGHVVLTPEMLVVFILTRGRRVMI